MQQKQATLAQRIKKALYPLVIGLSRLGGKNVRVLRNERNAAPKSALYDLSVELSTGVPFSLEAARGRKLLLVNTASDCGYTGQYAQLQALHEEWGDRLLIIGFPANDFREQEKGSDAEISQFCQINYGVRFPLAKKSSVVKGPHQHPVFRWLSDPALNGWNGQAPAWNFSKYLISEEGILTHYFDPGITPESPEFRKAI